MALQFPRYERVTYSRALVKGSCCILNLIFTGNGGGTATLKIRNGPTANSEIVTTLNISTADSKAFNFGKGLYLSNGCYIEINDYVVEALVLLELV